MAVTEEQLTGRAHEYPEGVPLHVQVASYSGLAHKALLALLKDPDREIRDILLELGVQPVSWSNWRYRLPLFAATADKIRLERESIRRSAALAIWESRTLPIAEAMADRAEGNQKDAQRAGERILETLGVLQKETPIIVTDPTRDMLSELRKLMAIAMGQAIEVSAPEAQEQAQQAMDRVLGPGEVVEEGPEEETWPPDTNLSKGSNDS